MSVHRGEHVVHFHRDDGELTAAVTRFILDGALAGERALILATASHWQRVRESLVEAGRPDAIDLVTFADADEVLRDATANGIVDQQQLAMVVDRLIGGSTQRVRIFGELVSLLMARGAIEAALEIERLGHQLAATTGAAILCSYDVRHIDTAGPDVRRVAAAHHRSVPDVPAGRAGGTTILLADDYGDTRDLYSESFRLNGYQVVTAETGRDAIRAARTWQPDLILMDIRMPDISGVDAMREIRQDERFTKIPIVAFTANALESARAEYVAAGFDAVIVKPCLPDALLEQVAALTRS
jgi:CheY-like chemotaxis protein